MAIDAEKTVFSLLGVGWMLATAVNSQSTLNQTCLGTIIQISILKCTLQESNWVFATNSNVLIHISFQLDSEIFQIHISWSNRSLKYLNVSRTRTTLCFKIKELEKQSLLQRLNYFLEWSLKNWIKTMTKFKELKE